ncbi:hypothetical protein HUT16_04980 [Kitasatospora sp. NA04385]|uniref:hypothetical protein n=1 Tax=Kitasatospora sp. NA04385 TaxID=2742135 RepID=UPI00159010D4|nr:hypothetical protein [Kitasatospora sp. NA04385]QKW18505.1 hypothetical protein HUT16_04980 [Kitasatospora sp. NA04385]
MRTAGRAPLLAGSALAPVLVLALALAATACTADPPKQQPVEVRTDTASLAKCVTLPGRADSVHWTYRALGATDSRVPGPTDHALDGIARLADGEAARLHGSGTWTPADASHLPPAELTALLDHPVGSWLRTEALDDESSSSEPHFLLDPGTGTLYFWAINPHCAD